MTSAYVARWAAAFALTQLVEIPLYLRALSRTGSTSRRFAIAFGASAITHPILWFIVPRLWMGGSYGAMAASGELFVFLAEWMWLARFDVRRAYLWSFGANGASIIVGLVVRGLFGWP